nr:MAG TPA: hypothetical protein [Caudoviricetes sp.]DAS55220.1 MAG TPA: hypothetical protein [Caudoviricetes sp.]
MIESIALDDQKHSFGCSKAMLLLSIIIVLYQSSFIS